MQLDAYIRVSRVGGRDGESFISPDVQRSKIEQWAQLRGVKIAKWHQDLDQSGGKLSRPGFDRALERVRASKTGGIVVAKLDRFSRAGVADALKLIESVHEAGGEVASVEEGIDPTTPFGEFAMTVLLALARMQRRQIADTWKEAQRRAVERGVHVASKPPTGYVRGEDGRLVVNEADAPHIAEAFRMKAAGASWKSLGLYLRDNGVVSPYGTIEWQPRALSHLFANPAYLGQARSGEFTNDDAHEPLVDRDTWEAAQREKGEKQVSQFGGSLLAGVLRCAGCGYTLKPDTQNDRDGTKLRLYRCRTERSTGRCPSPASTLGRVIEPFVIDTFLVGLRGLRAEGSTLTRELEEAERASEAAERELATYLAAVSAADVGAEAFAAGARQRRERADEARDALEDARERAGVADLPSAVELEAMWPDLTIGEQNELLRAGLERVVLRRGRTAIAERAEVHWRGA